MPEGHTIHRAALDHAKVLQGLTVSALSPQGRFANEAAQMITQPEVWKLS